MADLNYWLLFLSTAIALNIAPGPDVIYILTKTIANGRKIGFASSLGVCTGALFHVFAAAIGLSAILVTSSLAFTVVKFIGVGYLLYLAYQSFNSAGTRLNINSKQARKKETFWGAFKQGVLIDILNPKVAIFFMAFLPQFVRVGHGSVPMQLLVLGILIILIAIVVEFAYVLLASVLTNKINNSRTFSRWLDWLVGTIFVALGIRLAITSNTA